MTGARRNLCGMATRLASRHVTHRSPAVIARHSASSMSSSNPLVSASFQRNGAVMKDGNDTTRQWYHSTFYASHFVHKDAEAARPTETELNETDDTLPEWQNPLHQNDPEMQKMFQEDFAEGEVMPEIPLPPLETDPDKVVAPEHIHTLAHEIVRLNLMELKELTEKIANHFGFDDSMMEASYGGGGAMAAADGGAAGEGPAEAEVKTIFDLKLIGFDAKAKIKVIKEVRAIAGLGLKEAKELVESAPKVIQKDLKQDKADELKAQLEAVGAEVEIV